VPFFQPLSYFRFLVPTLGPDHPYRSAPLEWRPERKIRFPSRERKTVLQVIRSLSGRQSALPGSAPFRRKAGSKE
jgi:hypothetical protein